MSRDPWKLEMFRKADELVPRIYKATQKFPPEERYGLQGQLRRAAVSVATNIVEGSARLKAGEYRHFVNVALSSACETRYLVQLADRLKILPSDHRDLATEYDRVCKGLSRLVASLKDIEAEEKAMR